MKKNTNLILARKRAGLSQVELAKKLGLKQPYIAKLENGDSFSLEQANKIAEILGVTGKEILPIITEIITNNNTTETNAPSINKEHKGVPYFDIDFVGGFDLVYNSQQVKPAFYIDFLPFNDADYWVNVTGKSMGPLIAHGDLIALKEVREWKRFLLEGEIYAILTDNGFRTVKIIGKGPDKDHYMLIPYNKSEDYSPQPIPKEVITHVFRVKGAIKKFF